MAEGTRGHTAAPDASEQRSHGGEASDGGQLEDTDGEEQTKVGHFLLGRELGHGSFGTVRLGVDQSAKPGEETEFAVKEYDKLKRAIRSPSASHAAPRRLAKTTVFLGRVCGFRVLCVMF